MHPARAEARKVAALEEIAAKQDLILAKVSGEPLEPGELHEILRDPALDTIVAEQAKILARLEAMDLNQAKIREAIEQVLARLNAQEAGSTPTATATATKDAVKASKDK